jgi:PAS domain S-box-containing protein
LADVRRVQQTLDSIPVAAWRTRADGFAEYFNRRWLDYAGVSLDQVLGWQWAGSLHPEDLPRVNDIWLQLLASEKPGEVAARMRRYDGSYRWFLARAEPSRDDTGRVVAWYGTNTDIEDRTQALARLQEMESDFAHMNRVSVMGELAASLSHEILHPIAAARNNAWAGMRFLEMSPPNLDKAKVAFGCVIKDADRANDIVGRMRDQIKKAPPRKERFGLNEAINGVVDMVRISIAKNGIAVSAHLMDGLVPVWGDRVQLQQVVVNLILNAIDAMSSVENGPRELSIRTEQSQTGGVLVAVHDSGPGIEQENFERVFEPFSTTKSSGIGMGLAICRSIINGHGGRLWVAANEPRGAVFQFTLPAQEDS